MRRRTRLFLGAAVLVLAVVVVLVAGRGHGPSHPAALPTGAPSTTALPSPSPSGPVGIDVTGLTNRQATTATVDRWVAAVRPPPGANLMGVQVTTPGSSAGRRSPVVTRERIWSAPGTIKGVIAYYQEVANWPDHFVPSGTTSGSADGRHTSSGVLFTPPTSETHAYTQPQLQITVTAHGGDVEVTAQASAIVLPTRTAAEHIPAGVTAVAVTVTRPHRAAVRRTLTGAALRTLATLVNRQAPAPPAAATFLACMEKPKLTEVDRLGFAAPGHTIVVRVTVDDCPSRAVRVTANGRTQPGLDGGDAIDAAVIDVLGLPSAYRIN
jgi:hypothetical protein